MPQFRLHTFRPFLVCAVAALVSPFASDCAAEKSASPVLFEDFEEADDSGLYAALTGHRLLEAVEGAGVDGGTALLAAYEGYDQGSRRIVLQYPLGESGAEFTLNEYDVRFDEDFQVTRGGKLHGLAPENRVTGGNQVVPEGWSARVNFSGDGGVRSYLYSQRQDGTYGNSVANPDFRFEKGRCHAVSLHVKLKQAPRRIECHPSLRNGMNAGGCLIGPRQRSRGPLIFRSGGRRRRGGRRRES